MLAKQPNIVFLFTDDQRFDTIAALSDTAIRTPNLDKLVARGTSFTRAHIMGGTSGAVCMPSRAMVHTGRTLFHIHEQGQTIDPTHVMLGEHFQSLGYATAGFGKWHNSPESYARSFTTGGEIFFGGMADHWNVPSHSFDPAGKYESRINHSPNYFHSNRVIHAVADHVHNGQHSTDILTDACCDFLKEQTGDKPFLAYVAFLAPHDPRTMPEKYLEMYPPDEIELPPNFMPEHPFDHGNLRGRDEELAGFPRTEEETRQHIADYYAMITHLDDAVGRIFETLDQQGLTDDTIIVFAGDNGLACGQHGLMGKQNVYDHSTRVPLIFAGPGIPQNRQCDAFVYLIDIYPTLCDLVGSDVPDTVEGQSLTPAFADDASAGSWSPREYLHTAYLHIHRAVRDDRYKLIEYAVNGAHHTQLFDLQEDPWEMQNLAEKPEHQAHLTRLRDQLTDWRDKLGDPHESFWQTAGL